MVLNDIKKSFFEYAEKQGNPYDQFPLGTEIEEYGSPYIEVNDSQKMALVARDRGEECFRKETTSTEQLAKWIYEIFNQ